MQFCRLEYDEDESLLSQRNTILVAIPIGTLFDYHSPVDQFDAI